MQLGSSSNEVLEVVSARLPQLGPYGVAVSGGGDSLALLVAVCEIAAARGEKVEALTVDHGLRAESVEEADHVRRVCKSLDVQHATARWTGWKNDGNLQDAARQGRYRLISEWARRRELASVCIGHTLDDVAETFVMRLSRESGVDGLARMESRFLRHEVAYLRPMLTLSRESLRQFLTSRSITWREDPSNENDAFDRVRTRRALSVLSELGITSENLGAVADNLSQVRDVMKLTSAELAQKLIVQEHGDLVFARHDFLQAPIELRRRLLNDALMWMTDASYPLRRQAMAELLLAIEEQRNFSCNGCIVQVYDKSFRILREFNAVRRLTEFAPTWDRWQIEGPWRVGLKVCALGEPALAGVEDWRESGLPRQSLMASPAIWQGDRLIAAPLAKFVANSDEDWQIALRQANFHSYMTGSANSH